jgi:diguanylate cyclase (GGDEF)-like protein
VRELPGEAVLERLADATRRADREAALAHTAKALGESLDMGEVLATLCREVAQATGADVVLVHFREEDAGMTVVATHGVPDGVAGLRHEGFGSASPVELEDVRSAMSAPLRRHGGLDGTLSVGYRDGRPIGKADLELLREFAELASSACRNADDHAEAVRAASHDPLTGCLNHAAFHERLREEVSRAERRAEPFTLVLLDLEDFKAVNEHFGHLSGDAVLRTVGETLRAGVREYDHVARLGGDEFALVLPETDEREAASLVARILRSLEAAAMPGEMRLGAHSGVVEWRPGEPPTAVIERADQAVRGDKRAARADPGTAGARRRAEAARVGDRLAGLPDLRAMTAATVDELTGPLGYEYAALLRLTADGRVTAVATSGRGASPERESREAGAVRRCVRERRAVLVGDARRDPVAGRLEPGMRSELAVPVHRGTEVWGAIDLQSARASAFAEDDARLAELVADHLGAALGRVSAS